MDVLLKRITTTVHVLWSLLQHSFSLRSACLLVLIHVQEGSEGDGGGSGGDDMVPEMGSEEMERNLQRILEKIDHFTQQVEEHNGSCLH